MDNDWYVRIIEFDTGEVVEEMGPMYESDANRTARGVKINLNHDSYYVTVAEGEVLTD